jgi:hypothetical protein
VRWVLGFACKIGYDNYTREQLDAAHAYVDEHIHAIVHLEHTNELQDVKLEERVEVIISLEQQLQVLYLQVPPAPIDTAEPNAMSDVDE